MLLYLRYLNKNERKEWEESPIGLILCSEGNTEHIEYLMLSDNNHIKVAQYYTKLLYLQNFSDMDDFKKQLKKYIHYYNNDRIKLKLKGKSPVQYRTLYT